MKKLLNLVKLETSIFHVESYAGDQNKQIVAQVDNSKNIITYLTYPTTQNTVENDLNNYESTIEESISNNDPKDSLCASLDYASAIKKLSRANLNDMDIQELQNIIKEINKLLSDSI